MLRIKMDLTFYHDLSLHALSLAKYNDSDKTKMRENVRRSDKWNSLLPREKRKSSLPQCSCTRHVYRLGTHKERHFVLVLFLCPILACDRTRTRTWPLSVSRQVSCISRRNAKLSSFALASFISAKWLKLMHRCKKIAFLVDWRFFSIRR